MSSNVLVKFAIITFAGELALRKNTFMLLNKTIQMATTTQS